MDAYFYPRSFFGANTNDHHGHHGHRNNNDSTERNFTPLFRLLDDFDRYSGSRPGARASPPTFQPKFDVREIDAAYELHGELPGASRDNIHIEFTDPQTVTIRGRIERSYTAGTPENGDKQITEAGEGSKEAGEEKEKHGRTTPPLKATVQDETEAEEERTDASHDTSVAVSVPRTAPKKAPIKYWITERSIGEFTRNFTFPARIEQDGVAANLKDGVLTVVIPKSKKHEARRIPVNC